MLHDNVNLLSDDIFEVLPVENFRAKIIMQVMFFAIICKDLYMAVSVYMRPSMAMGALAIFL